MPDISARGHPEPDAEPVVVGACSSRCRRCGWRRSGTAGAAGDELPALAAATSVHPARHRALRHRQRHDSVVITIVCVWPIALNTQDGLASIDQTVIETVRSYHLRPLDRLRYAYLAAVSPRIFTGLRTSLSLAILMLVVAEMLGSTNGIGYFALHAEETFAINDMWAGILLLGILGYLLNVAFEQLERRVLRWYYGQRALLQ